MAPVLRPSKKWRVGEAVKGRQAALFAPPRRAPSRLTKERRLHGGRASAHQLGGLSFRVMILSVVDAAHVAGRDSCPDVHEAPRQSLALG